MGMMSETVGVVLFVRDEVNDIAGWLAWYRMLGFDACIVFDDGSTDGTRQLLNAASLSSRVFVHDAIGDRDVLFIDRQRQSYQYALKAYQGLDWLFFVDADEYLSLFRHETVQAFLKEFEQSDAVAVNWCNYGSGGHVLRPLGPAVFAYLWHTHETALVNIHVKSFVRPKKLGPHWMNVHAYDVDPERYHTASHDRVVWSNTRGLIEGIPDWSTAKLMHYQCRSMEHFVERVRKRPDLHRHVGEWQSYDRNDVEDRTPLRFRDTLPQFDILTKWSPLTRKFPA